MTSHTLSKMKPKLTSGSSPPPELGAAGVVDPESANPAATPSSVIAAPMPKSWATLESVSR